MINTKTVDTTGRHEVDDRFLQEWHNDIINRIENDGAPTFVSSGNTIAIGFKLKDGIHIFTAKNYKEDIYEKI